MDNSHISLDTCHFEVLEERLSTGTEKRIIIGLPKSVDLRGIKPSTGIPYGNYHDHYDNKWGDLVVACGGVARYFVPDELKELHKSKYSFCLVKSVTSWTQHKPFNEFVYQMYERELSSYLMESGDNEEISEVLKQHELLWQFTQYFINWVIEFGEIHGKNHLYKERKANP